MTSKHNKTNVVKKYVLVEQVISSLQNIQLKIDEASGAATALELRLRVIAQLEPRVLKILRIKTKEPFYKARLEHLMESVLEVFKENITLEEYNLINNCRLPRNKLAHASFVELMLKLNIEPTGREIDSLTLKGKLLPKHDIVESVRSIDKNQGFSTFSRQARIAINVLDTKIIRSLKDFNGYATYL